VDKEQIVFLDQTLAGVTASGDTLLQIATCRSILGKELQILNAVPDETIKKVADAEIKKDSGK
jgi:hypothetical protein